MDDNVVLRLEFKMGNIEIAHRVQCGGDSAFTRGTGARRAQLALDLPECAEHSGAIEALPFTVFAEAHATKFTPARRGVGGYQHTVTTHAIRMDIRR